MVIFLNFFSKHTQIRRILSSKIQSYFILHKTFISTNMRVLIRNMTIVFSNSNPEFLFGLNFKRSYMKLYILTDFSVLNSVMMLVIFKFYTRNIRMRRLRPKFKINFCAIFLSFKKLESADFKYGFFNFHPKANQAKHAWFPI